MREAHYGVACLAVLVACGSEVIIYGGGSTTSGSGGFTTSGSGGSTTSGSTTSSGSGGSTTSGSTTSSGSGGAGGMGGFGGAGGMGGFGGYPNACPAPTPTVLASNGGWRFGMDATHLYYSDAVHPYDLHRVDKCGGPPETLAVYDGNGIDLVVTGGYVYMVMHTSPGSTVKRVPITGGTPENFSPEPSGQGEKIYTDDTSIFWSEIRSGVMVLMQQALSSTTSITLHTDLVSRDFDIDDTHVYFFHLGAVKRIPKGSGTVETVVNVQNLGGPRDLQVDSSGIYYVYDWGAAMDHVPHPGGPVTSLASGGNIVSIALDATYIYISQMGAGTLERMTKQGTGLVTLASGFPVMQEVLLDNTSIYWLAFGPNYVVKLDLP